LLIENLLNGGKRGRGKVGLSRIYIYICILSRDTTYLSTLLIPLLLFYVDYFFNQQ
jgi:hypothetical protein